MKYQIQINNGNANLGITQKTLSVNEVLETVDQKFLSHHIHLHNPLIPEQVVSNVLENLITCSAELMAQGYAIQFMNGQDCAFRVYGDIHVKDGNINLDRARELTGDRQMEEAEMVSRACEIVSLAGITVRARAEVEKKFTDLLLAQGARVNRVPDIKEVAFIPASGTQSDGEGSGDDEGSGSGDTPAGGGNQGGDNSDPD